MKNIIEETGARIVPILQLSRMQSKAKIYRLSKNHTGGYCVFFDGNIESWQTTPKNPESFKLKTLLIGSDLDAKNLPTVYINVATDGDHANRAWVRIEF